MANLTFDDLPQAAPSGSTPAPVPDSGLTFDDLPAAKPGAKPQGAMQNFAQGLALGAGSAVHGVNSALGFIGDVETAGQAAADKYLPEWLSGRTPEEIKAGPSPHVFPTTEDYDRATDYLGLTGHEWEKPQNSAQEFVGKGISGATGSLLTLPLAPEMGVVKTAAQGMAGGLAAEGAKQAGAPPLVQALAGAGAGGATQLLQHLGAGDPVAKAASLLGGSTEFQQAGEHLQDAARVWRNQTMPVELSKAWAPIDQGIGPAAPTPIDNFHQTLKNMANSSGSLAPITGELTPGLVDRLLGATNDRMAPVTTPVPPQARTVKQIMLGQYPTTVVGPAATPTWDEVQQLRSTIGNAMSTPKIVEDIGQTRLNKLYGALTDDMRSSVGANGPPELMQAFDDANARSQVIYAHANGPISKIISDPNVTEDPKIGAETAAKRLLSGDPQNLAALAASMPKAVGQLASAFLNQTPEKWGKFSQAMKDALVPNETLQGMLNSALPRNPVKVGHAAAGGTVGAALGLAGGNQLLAPEIATVASHALGSTIDPIVAASLGGLGMAGLGMAGSLGRGIINSPGALLGPARGALASGTSNALVPSPEGPLLGH